MKFLENLQLLANYVKDLNWKSFQRYFLFTNPICQKFVVLVSKNFLQINQQMSTKFCILVTLLDSD